MSLNAEQCIEIAEKIWGWTPTTITSEDTWWIKDNTRVFTSWEGTDDLSDEVNSWQGFGRTVEAMAEKKLSLYVMSNKVDFVQIGQTWYDGLLSQEMNIEQLWEATHLAALEALK